jgi:hypothetical protein
MRKSGLDPNPIGAAAPMCHPSTSSFAVPTAGDALIEAIANAVVLKLERMAGMQQRLMDVKDGAKYLGMTEDALRHKAGVDVPCVRVDGKLRFDRRELDRWIDTAPRGV